MASGWTMSDEELQKKLGEFGEDVVPVTDSTRKILHVKLKKLEGNRNGGGGSHTKLQQHYQSANRKSLLGFSSDESENENASKATAASSSAVLNSIGAAMLSPFASPTTSAVNNNNSHRSPSTPSHQRRRSARLSAPLKKEVAAGEQGSGGGFVEPRSPLRRNVAGGGEGRTGKGGEIPEKKHTNTRLLPNRRRTTNDLYENVTNRFPQSHPDFLDTSGSDSDVSDNSMSNIPEHFGVDEFPPSARRSTVALTPIRVRGKRPATASPSSSATQREHNMNGHDGSSYNLVKSNPVARNDPYDENGDVTTASATPSSSTSNSSQCISMILVVILVSFFLVVGLIYLGAGQKDLVPLSSSSSSSSSPSPSDGSELTDTSISEMSMCKGELNALCIMNSDFIRSTVDAALELRTLLRNKAGEIECGAPSTPSSKLMSVEEVKRFLSWRRKDGTKAIYVEHLLFVFSKHPEWGIRLLGKSGEPVPPPVDAEAVTHIDSMFANLSLFCRLMKAARNTAYKVAIGFVAVFAGVATFVITYWTMTKKRKERQEVYGLVERILDVLQSHYRASKSNTSVLPFLAVPHVRDMLLSPSHRSVKRGVWEAALDFIQNNESRVRFETQSIEGEDFLVFRWLQPETPSFADPRGSASSSRSVRLWQGQAFEKLDCGINALPCSPTPCLKVRNMFDPEIEYEENWPTHIRDAILEKCGSSDIVHLQVFAASKEGCVYIKCRDSKTAGDVYRDLHGWWFDGKLVTVKYLRLERYHERYPESIGCHVPLKPFMTSSTPLAGNGMRLRSAEIS